MVAFDFGAYIGDTTKELLNYYNKVIAIDANPKYIDILKNKFKDNVSVEYGCISNYLEKTSKFHISNIGIWSSIFKEISERKNTSYEEIEVPNITVKDLIDKYGMPVYMKVDIEGADIFVLEQLLELGDKPKFISCESECIGDRDIKDGEDVKVLNKLKELGYTKFALYNNRTHKINEDIVIKSPFSFNFNWVTYDKIYELIKSIPRDNIYSTYHFWFDIFATY